MQQQAICTKLVPSNMFIWPIDFAMMKHQKPWTLMANLGLHDTPVGQGLPNHPEKCMESADSVAQSQLWFW